ncbi:unnamed protein product, partial [Adineta steineri]
FGQETIQREEWRDGGTAYQFKLRGNPWISNGEDAATTRLKLLSLLDYFNNFGWKLHASIVISQDHPEPPPAYSLHQHACISLNSSDCLRFIRFPRSVIDVLRQTIIESWLRGIQREEDYEDAHEFKLYGNPWWGQGDDAVPSRILMIHILSALYNKGWYLLTSTHISKKPYDKDSLIFQLGIPPSPTSFFSVSFNDYDKLNLICAPSELIPAVQQTLGQETILREEWCDSGTAYHFKLRGNPWISSG